jgi:hypothetical protein
MMLAGRDQVRFEAMQRMSVRDYIVHLKAYMESIRPRGHEDID